MLNHSAAAAPHGSLRHQPQRPDFVRSGSHTLGRLRANSNAAELPPGQAFHLSPLGENTILARLQREDGSAVPVQVTTMDGSQFLCLNFNNEVAESGVRAGALSPSATLPSQQPISVSSLSTPIRQLQPQFAQPISAELVNS